MKKILGLMVAALLIIAVVGGGTWAYFQDTETQNDNTITAGTLDLTTGGQSGIFSAIVTDAYPSKTGTGKIALTNGGSLGGKLSVTVSDVTTTAGVLGEYAGGTELGSRAQMMIYIDYDQSGTWTNGDKGLWSDGTTYNFATTLFDVIGTADSGTATTLVDNALTQAVDFFNGMTLTITAGTNVGESRTITDFDADADTITVGSAFTAAIDNTSEYAISLEGTVDSATATTVVDDALTQADNFFNGMNITITAGTGAGQSRAITDFDAATDTVTVGVAFDTTPDATSKYSISRNYDFIDNYELDAFSNVTNPMTSAAADNFVMQWRIPANVSNEIQGDSVAIDFTFTLDQLEKP